VQIFLFTLTSTARQKIFIGSRSRSEQGDDDRRKEKNGWMNVAR